MATLLQDDGKGRVNITLFIKQELPQSNDLDPEDVIPYNSLVSPAPKEVKKLNALPEHKDPLIIAPEITYEKACFSLMTCRKVLYLICPKAKLSSWCRITLRHYDIRLFPRNLNRACRTHGRWHVLHLFRWHRRLQRKIQHRLWIQFLL